MGTFPKMWAWQTSQLFKLENPVHITIKLSLLPAKSADKVNDRLHPWTEHSGTTQCFANSRILPWSLKYKMECPIDPTNNSHGTPESREYKCHRQYKLS